MAAASDVATKTNGIASSADNAQIATVDSFVDLSPVLSRTQRDSLGRLAVDAGMWHECIVECNTPNVLSPDG